MRTWAENQDVTLEQMEMIRSGDIPVGRLGEPEELASLVCYLLSGKNTYITGQVIAVDGGFIKSAL
jgi:3-oxoacyl-[acyl-carrier protein] reductase